MLFQSLRRACAQCSLVKQSVGITKRDPTTLRFLEPHRFFVVPQTTAGSEGSLVPNATLRGGRQCAAAQDRWEHRWVLVTEAGLNGVSAQCQQIGLGLRVAALCLQARPVLPVAQYDTIFACMNVSRIPGVSHKGSLSLQLSPVRCAEIARRPALVTYGLELPHVFKSYLLLVR